MSKIDSLRTEDESFTSDETTEASGEGGSAEECQNVMGEEDREELEMLKRKYTELLGECERQRTHLERESKELSRTKEQLESQSAFCASLGSIMGSLLWKASRLQPVVHLLLTTNKLAEFVCLVSGTLVSFVETYGKTLPGVGSDELQFVLSLLGILANVAALPEGRHFLVTDSNGVELIHRIGALLPRVPPSQEGGHHLKKILLMALYNASIDECGLALVQAESGLLSVISEALVQVDADPPLRPIALRLLDSITSDIASIHILVRIRRSVPLQMVVRLDGCYDEEERTAAKNVVTNLMRGAERLRLKSEMPGEYGLLLAALGK